MLDEILLQDVGMKLLNVERLGDTEPVTRREFGVVEQPQPERVDAQPVPVTRREFELLQGSV